MGTATSDARKGRYSRATVEALELLGKLIRAERIERRWPAQELAERVGVSRDLIERIERGDPRCGIGAAFEAAAIVGVALFERDAGRLGRHIADQDARLRLLPKAARHKRAIADDF
ncbi:MAG: helix-turn-helix transcriptional regulator [Sphingomicrobium sp.]